MSALFVFAILVWTVLCLTRFVDVYDTSSPFQRWRRWDAFHLVPFGAFFGPSVPVHEPWILMRTSDSGGTWSPWSAVPDIGERRIWHVIFNPNKQAYAAAFTAAHALLVSARHARRAEGALSNSFLMSDPYLRILRQVTHQARMVPKTAVVQFAVVEIDLRTGAEMQSVVSALHKVRNAASR